MNRGGKYTGAWTGDAGVPGVPSCVSGGGEGTLSPSWYISSTRCRYAGSSGWFGSSGSQSSMSSTCSKMPANMSASC